MIRIALIKKDGTWKEMKLRMQRSRYGEIGTDLIRVVSYLMKKKFIVDGKLPKDILEIAILPKNYKGL